MQRDSTILEGEARALCGVRRLLLPMGLFLIAFILAEPAWAASAFVRVNQVGYAAGEPKRAYLMASGSESGATFVLQNGGGTTVFGPAAIGANQGSWGSFPNVYALDFDPVSASGTYTIVVSGPIAATSPSFPIDMGTNIYATPLANTLSYYQNGRDGANFIAAPLRTAAAHLNDQSASVYLPASYDANGNLLSDLTATGTVIDASGGWFDAADYLKFVETHSYTVALLLVGVRDFPTQMGASSSTSNFTAEAKFGLDWLQKMWDDNNKILYYQVAIGACDANNTICISDHDIWRLPQADDTYQGTDPLYRYIRHRPVFINPNGGSRAKISPNLAGRLAADFAECYQVYKASNAVYANQCLLSAEHIFDLADTAPSGNLTSVSPFGFYPEAEWRDDMELGATELYLALQPGNLPNGLPHTDPMFYLTAAANWAHAHIVNRHGIDTLNLYDVSGLAHFELYRAFTLAGNPGGLAVTQAALLADLKAQIDSAVTVGNTDPFGFGFGTGGHAWNTNDTASHGAGLSVMSSEYDYLTGANTYRTNASRWLANILGANAWGTSFIVGDGTVFPDCIQHQPANLLGSLNGGSPVLNGAVVEGPNSIGTSGSLTGMKACDASARFTPFNGNGAVFVDNVQSFNTVEPAIDLTASSPLAFAWQTGSFGVAGGATHYSVTAPASSTAGSAFNITVMALDDSNRTITSYTGMVHFTSSDGQPVLPADSTLTNGAGTVSVTLKTAGSQTVTATDTVTNTITGTSAAITVNPGTTVHFKMQPSATTVTASTSSNVNVTVTAQDVYNNTTPAYWGTVHFASGDPQAVLPANSTLTSGVGTFPVTLKTAGPQTVFAIDSVTASINGSSSSITVNNAPASKYSLTSPATATVNANFTIRLVAQDQFNNTAKDYTGKVHFTTSDAGGGVFTPPDYTFVSGDSGQKIVNPGFTLQTAGAQTITATDAGNGAITQTNNITVTTDAFITPQGRNIYMFRPKLPLVVASFTDADLTETGSNFTATIDWGDGTTPDSGCTPGSTNCKIVRVGSTNVFNVLGMHTYKTKRVFTVHVVLTDSGGSVADAFSTARFFPISASR